MEAYAIPLGSAIVSATALILVAWNQRGGRERDYVEDLQEENSRLRIELSEARAERDRYYRETVELMRQLTRKNGGNT